MVAKGRLDLRSPDEQHRHVLADQVKRSAKRADGQELAEVRPLALLLGRRQLRKLPVLERELGRGVELEPLGLAERELEAFAQFGSELDQATQSSLNRGEKMVATLNQPQYQPWPMEEQVAALYAGVNGYLDDIPTEDVSRFQDELREHLRAEGTIYKDDPRDTGDIGEDVEATLEAELEKFKGRFQSSADKEAA